uniref:Annexin n=1 Tax=Hydatigena taeniaeformis TaxID=6205 RepID=A0A0R3X1P8_HYDTA
MSSTHAPIAAYLSKSPLRATLKSLFKWRYMACVKPAEHFDPSEDARTLESAMKGFGSDAGLIIDILAHRSSSQRREIESVYKAHFGKDLRSELGHELSGKFKQAVLWSFGDKAHVNATALFKAIDRTGTDELMLIDVLCTATNKEIEEIKDAYLDASNRNLEADVKADTFGDIRKVLIALLQASRQEGCDDNQAKSDSFELFQAGEGQHGMDESTFTRIFCTRSWEQLRKIDEIYCEVHHLRFFSLFSEKHYGHDLITVISKEASSDYKIALKLSFKPNGCSASLRKSFKDPKRKRSVIIFTINDPHASYGLMVLLSTLQTATDPNDTIVEMLYRSMKGMGTNDDNLIRIILAHSEPCRRFDANGDAQTLKEAVKGIGTDETIIIDILSHRTSCQRQDIAQAYKSQYGEDLLERLHKELSGKFRQAVEWSFYDRAHVNAAALKEAMKGAGTNEGMLIDVLCTATNDEVEEIKEAYMELTQRSLEDDVKSETSGDLERVLVAILQAERESDCDHSQAHEDAIKIYEAGEKKHGTDESTFTRILCTRSYDQIREINEVYQDVRLLKFNMRLDIQSDTILHFINTQEFGRNLADVIKSETSGDYEKALSRIVMMSKDPYNTFADMLYNAMAGAGTNDDSLIRILLAHSEDDLRRIQTAFDNISEKSLAETISDDTSGDYKKFLLAILE